MFMPLAFGVAPPSSLSGAPWPAPEPEALTGDERKKSGDCVDADCNLAFLGVAWGPRCDACEASDWSCSSGPAGPGLEGACGFSALRPLRRGVADADADERCERRLVGEDIVISVYTEDAVWAWRGNVSRRAEHTRRARRMGN
jgi:hypothetical protein